MANSCPIPITKNYLFQDFYLVALFVSDKWSFMPILTIMTDADAKAFAEVTQSGLDFNHLLLDP